MRARRIAVDTVVPAVAAGTMALMVLVGGALIDEQMAPALTISPAPVIRSVQPRLADLELDDSDAVVVTRRKAAAREIERQWHAHEAVEGN